jgi:hypothetical protein
VGAFEVGAQKGRINRYSKMIIGVVLNMATPEYKGILYCSGINRLSKDKGNKKRDCPLFIAFLISDLIWMAL